MCIENEKCLNCISIRLAAVFTFLFAVPEALFYWLTANIRGMVIFPLLSTLVFVVIVSLRDRQMARKVATVAYCLTQVLHCAAWGLLVYNDFYNEELGKQRCDKGKEGVDGTWIFEGIEFQNFEECHAEADSQIAVIYIVVVALIGLKFFFVHILHLWYKESLKSNQVQLVQTQKVTVQPSSETQEA